MLFLGSWGGHPAGTSWSEGAAQHHPGQLGGGRRRGHEGQKGAGEDIEENLSEQIFHVGNPGNPSCNNCTYSCDCL